MSRITNYFKSLLLIELLKGMVTRETADGLELSTDAELAVMASNFRSVRGRSIACAILDECAFWRSDNTINPDAEILNAVRPGLGTTGGPLFMISSPYATRRVCGPFFRGISVPTAIR